MQGQESANYQTISAEETSTQVEVGFTAALDAEGLMAEIYARYDDGRIDLGVDDGCDRSCWQCPTTGRR